MANTLLLDGKYARGFYVNRPRISWPFAQNGDYVSTVTEREWRQSAAKYFPGKRGVDRDPVDTLAYLITETDPEPTGIGDVIRTTRAFARIPAEQTVQSSLFVTKPDIPGLFPQSFGIYHIRQPATTVASFDAYQPQTVTADSGFSINVTGGTYTLTFGANTTGAISYNAVAATVQTALNALTSVTNYGGVVVTGAYTTGFTITFNAFAASAVTSSLTGYLGSATITNVSIDNSGFRQFVSLQRIPTAITPAWSADLTGLTKSTGGVLAFSSFGSGASLGLLIQFSATDAATQSVSTAGLSVSGGDAFLYSSLSVPSSNLQWKLRIDAQSAFPSQPAYTGSFTLTGYGQTSSAISITSIADGDTAALKAAIVAGIAGMTNLAARGTITVTVDVFTKRFGGAGFSTLTIDATILILPQITAGTYTLTVFAQTTAAIAYNATFAATATALNNLSNVAGYGGVIITSYNGLSDPTGTSGYTGNLIQFSYAFQGSSSPSFSGGTFTITIFAQTTAAIALGASTTDVQGALNALANVAAHGGVIVSGAMWNGTNTVDFSFVFAAAQITGTSSLTPSPAVVTGAITDSFGRVQTIVLSTLNTSRFLVIPAHGFVSSDVLMATFTGPTYVYEFAFTIIDDNTIAVSAAASPFNVATIVTQAGKRTTTAYQPGSALTRVNRITNFYLPGITAGIATADDIPLPEYQGSQTALLEAIFANDESINYQVGELEQWRLSPILQRSITVINATQL